MLLAQMPDRPEVTERLYSEFRVRVAAMLPLRTVVEFRFRTVDQFTGEFEVEVELFLPDLFLEQRAEFDFVEASARLCTNSAITPTSIQCSPGSVSRMMFSDFNSSIWPPASGALV
jgi:hypothetical protein